MLGQMLSPGSNNMLSPLHAALSPAPGGGFTALLLPTPRDPANEGGGAQLMPSPTAVPLTAFKGVAYKKDKRKWQVGWRVGWGGAQGGGVNKGCTSNSKCNGA